MYMFCPICVQCNISTCILAVCWDPREKQKSRFSGVKPRCKTKVLEIDMLLKELNNGKHSQGDEIFEQLGGGNGE